MKKVLLTTVAAFTLAGAANATEVNTDVCDFIPNGNLQNMCVESIMSAYDLGHSTGEEVGFAAGSAQADDVADAIVAADESGMAKDLAQAEAELATYEAALSAGGFDSLSEVLDLATNPQYVEKIVEVEVPVEVPVEVIITETEYVEVMDPDALADAYDHGVEAGWAEGLKQGYIDGTEASQSVAFNEGYDQGVADTTPSISAAADAAYADGYATATAESAEAVATAEANYDNLWSQVTEIQNEAAATIAGLQEQVEIADEAAKAKYSAEAQMWKQKFYTTEKHLINWKKSAQTFNKAWNDSAYLLNNHANLPSWLTDLINSNIDAVPFVNPVDLD